MKRSARRLIRNRAGDRCEYCRLPQRLAGLASFHVEHVRARQHGGTDDPDNLCWSCHRCNLNKGPNLSGIDPDGGQLVPLFNPRGQSWPRHFRLAGPLVVGRTRVGRATVAVLAMNEPLRVDLRRHLIATGDWPAA